MIYASGHPVETWGHQIRENAYVFSLGIAGINAWTLCPVRKIQVVITERAAVEYRVIADISGTGVGGSLLRTSSSPSEYHRLSLSDPMHYPK